MASIKAYNKKKLYIYLPELKPDPLLLHIG